MSISETNSPHYTVALTGTYNSCNKGDAAMQLAMSSQLAQRFGDAVSTVLYSPFPQMDAPFYRDSPVRFDDRRKLIRSTFGLVSSQLKREFASADLVIDLSGDMLTEDYGPHVAWSHFLPLLRAQRSGTPYMLAAQSIGPFKLTTPIARQVIGNAAAVTVRDSISRDYLGSLGLEEPLVKQTADMAFLLDAIGTIEADRFIADTGLNPAKPVVAVSLSRLVAKRYDKRHGEGAFVALMAQALGALAYDHGVQLLFVAHVTGPTPVKDDRIIAREVLGRMDASGAALFDRDARPEELKGVVGRCCATIGCRMHANIASLSSKVPVLALAYSHKTPGIMRACGLEDMVLDVDHFEPAEFSALVNRLVADRETLAQRLVQPVADQVKAARENIEIVARLLDKSVLKKVVQS